MLYRSLAVLSALALSTTIALSGNQPAKQGFALMENGKTLVKMKDLSNPGQTAFFKLDKRLDAIAYRPVTGELIGFSRKGAIYSIDPKSGSMENLSADFAKDAKIKGDSVAFDFNNKIDAVRAVGSDGSNLVYFPTNFADDRAGKVKRFTDTFYAEGDVNHGQTPEIFANAYTNAIAGKKAGSTFQYALDANTNSLVSLANNAGELKTVAKVTVNGKPADLVAAGGFDITSEKEGKDAAYAVLQMADENSSGLYSIDLKTAKATLLAELETTNVAGFAVALNQ